MLGEAMHALIEIITREHELERDSVSVLRSCAVEANLHVVYVVGVRGSTEWQFLFSLVFGNVPFEGRDAS